MSRYEAAREDNTLAEAMAAGRTALREGAWAAAIDAFSIATERAAAGDPLVAEAWEAVGQAAYWRDDASRAIEAHERAFSAYRRLNEPAAAARTALWLADDHLSFFSAGAVANGWVEQAERLLESTPSAPEQAWLPIYQGHCALQLECDTERALSFAADALERARSLGVPAAEVVALALEGLALVVQGDVNVGMLRLDEASAAAAARELADLNAIAWAFCYLIHGCDTIRDFSRAAEWCERVMAFCERWGLGPIFTSCRTRYASVLTWQGEWESAESQIDKILAGQTGGPRPPAAARSALIRLAELRRRQGRLDEAEPVFQQAGEHQAALLGRAAIAWARREPDVVMDLADRALRRLPRDARSERADALLLRILAAARLGDIERATEDLRELSDNEVAKELFLSPHTVKRHIANILRKLECPSRAAAVARASHAGVL